MRAWRTRLLRPLRMRLSRECALGTRTLVWACLAALVVGILGVHQVRLAWQMCRDEPGNFTPHTPPPEWLLATIPKGTEAPDFTLSDVTGREQVRLSSFRGRRPVVLIFGSFT